MIDAQITLGAWDLVLLVVGVAAYTLILMMSQQSPHAITCLVLSGAWLLHVVLSMVLHSRSQSVWTSEVAGRMLRSVNLVNLGMSLCATLYHITLLVAARDGYAVLR